MKCKFIKLRMPVFLPVLISGDFVVCNKSSSESSCVLIDDNEKMSYVSSMSSLTSAQPGKDIILWLTQQGLW